MLWPSTAHTEVILGAPVGFETCPYWVPAMDSGQRFGGITLKTMPVHGFDHSASLAASARSKPSRAAALVSTAIDLAHFTGAIASGNLLNFPGFPRVRLLMKGRIRHSERVGMRFHRTSWRSRFFDTIITTSSRTGAIRARYLRWSPPPTDAVSRRSLTGGQYGARSGGANSLAGLQCTTAAPGFQERKLRPPGGI